MKRRWARKCGGPKFMWTVLCKGGGGRANAAGPSSCGRCVQQRRWARKCGAHIHVDNVLRKRRWARKCCGSEFMWTVFRRGGGGRANAAGPNSCGRCLQKRRWARKGGGPKFMWMVFAARRWARKCGRPRFMRTAIAEAAVDAQMRRVQIHVDGVRRSGGGGAHAAGPTSCGQCFAETAVGTPMRRSTCMWTEFAETAVGAHMRRAQIHVDGVLWKRRWTRKCGGPKFMWTVFCKGGGGRANAAGNTGERFYRTEQRQRAH